MSNELEVGTEPSVPVSREEFEELVASVQAIADELDALQISKRGPEGLRGEKGEASNVPGPQGNPGRDGRDAILRIGSVVAGESATARLENTQDGQVLHLTLPRGERGERGADSNVPGAKGEPGIDGKHGKDGRDGVDGKHGKDGRNGVGTNGKDGRDGVDGKDGVGVKGEKGDPGEAAFIDEEKLLETFVEKAAFKLSTQLESRFRHLWKNDIQAGLRGHMNESHQDLSTKNDITAVLDNHVGGRDSPAR